MNFDANERALLAALADVLIPAGDGFPSGSEAGVADAGLDQVLTFRPDLAAGLKDLLGSVRGQSAVEFVAALPNKDPAGFELLTELVPGAYFLNQQVLDRLNYHDQGPQPIDPRPDYLDDDLLRTPINRGPIYRPTPGGE